MGVGELWVVVVNFAKQTTGRRNDAITVYFSTVSVTNLSCISAVLTTVTTTASALRPGQNGAGTPTRAAIARASSSETNSVVLPSWYRHTYWPLLTQQAPSAFLSAS